MLIFFINEGLIILFLGESNDVARLPDTLIPLIENQ